MRAGKGLFLEMASVAVYAWLLKKMPSASNAPIATQNVQFHIRSRRAEAPNFHSRMTCPPQFGVEQWSRHREGASSGDAKIRNRSAQRPRAGRTVSSCSNGRQQKKGGLSKELSMPQVMRTEWTGCGCSDRPATFGAGEGRLCRAAAGRDGWRSGRDSNPRWSVNPTHA